MNTGWDSATELAWLNSLLNKQFKSIIIDAAWCCRWDRTTNTLPTGSDNRKIVPAEGSLQWENLPAATNGDMLP